MIYRITMKDVEYHHHMEAIQTSMVSHDRSTSSILKGVVLNPWMSKLVPLFIFSLHFKGLRQYKHGH